MRRLLLFSVFFIAACSFVNAQYNVKDFGAKGDGVTLDTRFIQLAIDKAYKSNGGVIEFPAGTYKIGTIILKDNISLNLQAGAMLLGSPNYNDYITVNQQMESRTKNLYTKYFMIFAEGVNNISITGSGVIHGNGLKYFQDVKPQNLRPFMMRLVSCQNVTLRGVSFLESANWTLHLLGCRNVNIDGIAIENTARGNRDGLDIDACQRVTVSNSRFITTDDAIVLKSTYDVLCQDISITNCIMSTTGSAVKTGTESNGGFKNITVSNCVFKDVPNHAGIELMTVDGGIMQNILVENITMENVNTPIFIRIGNRARPYKAGQYVNKMDDVRDIQLNNISVLNAKLPSSIMGLHYKKIKNISINNYTVRNSNTQEPIPYNKVPFEEFSYPMALMFKNLPAYGIYCRNVEDLHIQNAILYTAENEKRPAFVFDRVDNLELFSLKAEVKESASPMVYLRNNKNVVASFCRSLDMNNALFEIEGNSQQNIHLSNNLLHTGQKETAIVPALEDDGVFEDFHAEYKYSVDQGNIIDGLLAHDLKIKPLKVDLNIEKSGQYQIRLLILNSSHKPQKVILKYEGIIQEFLISWNNWGWASLTLLKEFKNEQKVNVEIISSDQDPQLKISKVYLVYLNTGITD